jgi:uncharacterized protein (TIGR02001 family)
VRPWPGLQAAVTVRAEAPAFQARGSRTNLLIAGAALVFAAIPGRADAQVAATASLFSDLRFRGYSLSGGHPVAMLDFAFDDPSGVYGDVTATSVFQSGGEPAPLALQLSGGYAKRFNSGTTLDLGVTHSNYSRYYSGGRGTSYTELYVGASRGGLSSRIFLSPHYFTRGLWVVYGEVDGSVQPARNWSLDGHIGMLVPVRTTIARERYHAGFDWRLGATRDLGRLALHAAWTEGARGSDYYGGRAHHRSAVIVGASWAL